MLQSYSNSLRNLLQSAPFQAQSLITPKDEFVSLETNATRIEVTDIVKNARNKHISSIVIFENHRPIGYSVIPTSDRRLKSYDPRSQYIKFRPRHYLNYDDTLEEIISKFVDVDNLSDKTASPPIFLIADEKGNRDDPMGLMTYWDLNRRSVYSFIYTIFVYFEQSMKIEIYKSHKNGYHNCIRDFIQRRDANRQNPRRTYDGTDGLKLNISKLKFLELQNLLYDAHASPEVQEKFPTEVIVAVGSKRNQIAHPVNLVMDNGLANLAKNLRTLYTICVKAKALVIDHDDNSKNTMYSSPMNEIGL